MLILYVEYSRVNIKTEYKDVAPTAQDLLLTET